MGKGKAPVRAREERDTHGVFRSDRLWDAREREGSERARGVLGKRDQAHWKAGSGSTWRCPGVSLGVA